MREVVYANETVDLSCAATLSEKWDEKHPQEDTEYLNIDCAVLGSSVGKKTLSSDDLSSAWAAVHGRKYNNAHISIPFTREFVTAHLSEIEKITAKIQARCTGSCAVVQQMMTDEDKAMGREAAMRTQAIRDAKEALMTRGAGFDQDLFNEANRSVRADVASKVYLEHGVSVSARRIKDQTGLEQKKQFKRKTVLVGNSNVMGYVTTMDEKGLKKVPLMTPAMRDKAEKIVLEFAKVIKEEITKIAEDPTSEKCLAAIKAISEKMGGDDKVSVQIPDYTPDELSRIAAWREEVLRNYMTID